MDAALAVGSVDPEVVAIEARRVGEGRPAAVIPIGVSTGEGRAAPKLDGYDELLVVAR